MQSRFLQAAGVGLVGALAVTLIHETARRLSPRAPRMDILGERAIARTLHRFGLRAPRGRRLHQTALVGDIVSNSAYYALVGAGRRPWLRGLLLGGLAGVGAVLLPPVLGLGRAPRGLTRETKAMTVAWYLAGGLASAAAKRALERPFRARLDEPFVALGR